MYKTCLVRLQMTLKRAILDNEAGYQKLKKEFDQLGKWDQESHG